MKEKRRKITKLRIEDCRSLSILLNNGFTFRDALRLFHTSTNEKAVDEILVHLNQGEKIIDFIEEYIPDVYAVYFSSFLLYMPLGDALFASMAIVDQHEKEKSKLLKGLLYPVLLFYGTQCGILLFHFFIFPSVSGLLISFDTDLGIYDVLQNVMSLLAGSIILMTVIGCLFCYLAMKKDLLRVYCFLFEKSKNCLPIRMASVDFARFFRECVKRKLSTIDAVNALKKMKKRPLVVFIAEQLDTYLSRGEAFIDSVENCYVEETLMRFMKIAVYSSDCEAQITGYLELNEKRTEADIERTTVILQSVSYAAVGVLLVLVYQILLLPMNMLQNL